MYIHTYTYICITHTYTNYAFIVRRFVFLETNEQSGSGMNYYSTIVAWGKEKGGRGWKVEK